MTDRQLMAATGARTRAERWPVATIASLAAGSTLADAARAGGVGERTVNRWKNTAAFSDAVNAHRSEAMERSRAALVAASGVAVEALVDVARTGPPAARVAAARAILDVGARYAPQAEAYDRDRDARAIAGANGCSLEEAYSALDRAEEMLREYRE